MSPASATGVRQPDNLPADLTRLVGRRAETAAVKRLLADSRLVTVAGAGGVGKTRLAVRVGRQLHAAHAGGVRFVPLAELSQPELVVPAISAALPPVAGATGVGVGDLIRRIGDQQLLLILDNCEHLVEACAEVVGQLLRGCRNVRVLTTSRERLRVDGEAVYVLRPLSAPEGGSATADGDDGAYDAVTLFLERAAATNADFAPTAEDRQVVRSLVARLDGLPLAIELVAGRVGAVPLASLAARLDDRFNLLTGGNRSAPRRHQTLRATVDYSYELCSEPARLLWARLSVFVGGAALDAIVDVCADARLSAGEVDAALGELVDKSIVVFDGSRYQMLVTLREYGLERLREIDDERAARTAHRDHFLAVASSASNAVGRQQRNQLETLLSDEANLYAALERCVADPEHVELGLSVAAALWPFWVRCGRAQEGRYWLDLLLSAGARPTQARVQALWVSGQLAVHRGDMDFGLALATECEQLAVRLGDRSGVAHATYVQGSANLHLDHLDAAIADLESAVLLEGEPYGETPILVMSLELLGAAMCCGGRRDRAIKVLEEARRLSELHNDDVLLNGSLLWLGLAKLLDGEVGYATELLGQVLVQGRVIEDLLVMSTAVEFLAWAAQLDGNSARAARLMGVSQALAEPLGVHLAGFRGLHAWHRAYRESATASLGAAAFEAEFAAGRGLSMQSAIDVVHRVAGRRPAGPADAEADEATPLTRREHEIARLVGEGKTNKAIAAALVISPRTVESHVEHILAKLGFSSRHELVAMFAAKAARS